MSQAHIETLRFTYEAVNRGDWDSVFRALHPDFELKAPDRMMRAGTYRGAVAARQFFEDLLQAFEEVVVQPDRFFESGERTVVFVSLRSRPSGSSVVMEIQIAHIWTMRDNRAVQLEIFPERESALEAAGLSGQDAHVDS
jgi:ketosteroid isomerase-like protein